MAQLIGGMVCLDEAEAGAVAALLRHTADRTQPPAMAEALLLLAHQLQTMKDQDPFEVRRFTISVEPKRTRQ